ncbi:hypothetical protein JWS13_02235 (plasmid) [Rhodococcus pseudokoreensis]|uniref:Ig-like domain-containing protein n=1 Tax=Rhodococcus pseudokoreensis TaxID=2811421 RepID=A0A974ZRB6_9NOCA|nr:hypothetical protein [Rhodococcus pseudokoreensis]QSE87460.1 hypothetical protein JWS13_02235 [Rhodococcus pseudokoreensis]
MRTATQRRRTGWGIMLAAAIAGVMGVTASPASAEPAPTTITISSEDLYVNETYTVTVHCQERSTVGVAVDVDPAVAEQSDLLGGIPVAPNEDLLATVQWRPTSIGTHTLYAYGCASGVGWPDYRPPTASLTVDVMPAPTGTGSADGIPVIGPILRELFG